ncbi:acyltransferase, partial [Oleiphilus sp. HI0080]
MPLAYRKEIDGLRALAIIPVLLFHAGIPGFSGGFVGVDVFFVISGYLIGGQILFALENKSFSFAEFYFRRARRILPVFLFVLIVCSIAAWVLLHPVALVEFSWNAIASVGFS